jgi:hypothetical protein
MGFGSAFKSAWNSATSQARQKAAEIATGAKQVGARVQEQSRAAADRAATAANWAAQQASKAAGAAAQQAQKAAAQVGAQAAALKNAAVAKGQAVKAQAAKHAASLANKAKQAFAQAKTDFKNAVAKRPAAACPVPPPVIRPYPHGDGSSVAAYDVQTQNAGLSLFKSEGKAGQGNLSLETSAVKGRLTTYEGDLCNPTRRSDLEAAFGAGEAKLRVLVGYAQRRIGFGAGGSLSVSAASVSGEQERNFDLPFRDWSVSVRLKGGAEALGVGAGAGAHGYVDLDEKRAHLKGFLAIDALKGFNLGLDISIGKKYATPQRSNIYE